MTLRQLVEGLFNPLIERANDEVYVNCPFCQEQGIDKADTKTRLGINTRTGIGHCFKCEWKSGNRSEPARSRRKLFNELCRIFGVQYSIDSEDEDYPPPVAEEKQEPEKVIEVKLPKEYEPLWKNVNDSFGRKALKYLLSRSVLPEQIKRHKIGFCAAGKYSHRIVFPVYVRGKLEGFVTRDFSGIAEAKYLNSLGNKTLYNLPDKKDRLDTAILAEGCFDVLAIERCSLNVDILGNLGSKLTSRQLQILKSYSRIIIWAEPDKAGVEGTIKRALQLQKKKVTVLIIPPDEDIETDTDPGAMQPYEIKDRFCSATPFTKGLAAIMRTRIAFSAPPKIKKKGKCNGKDKQDRRNSKTLLQ